MRLYTMIKPLVITAALTAAMFGAQSALGADTGNPQRYSTTLSIEIAALGGIIGSGSASGSGVFDTAEELEVESVTSTLLVPLLDPTQTTTAITATTTYEGAIVGTTFTSNGTSTTDTISCVGLAIVCDTQVIGVSVATGAESFELDICDGGSFSAVIVGDPTDPVAPTLTTNYTFAPQENIEPCQSVIPVAGTAIPTMSAYGLGLTMLGVFIVAARRLRASVKLK